MPWPLFTAYKDGNPIIGAKLYSFSAYTSTPKATFADPFLIVPNTNPVIMDAHGQAMVYLQGFYRLVLTDAVGVMLWEVDAYAFESSTEAPVGGVVFGMAEGVAVAADGARVLDVANLVPLGYRVEGAIARVDTTFGASRGLTQIALGDSVLLDGWGAIGLDAGLTTLQKDFRRADRPIAPTAYVVRCAALGGLFDGAGQLTVRAHWSSLGGWV